MLDIVNQSYYLKMENLDISSSFISNDKLDKLYNQVDIDKSAAPEYVGIGHPLDYAHQSSNQISTIKTDNNVKVYGSAQNYYQSEKIKVLGGPEYAEQVRVSKAPFRDSWVPHEAYTGKKDTWAEQKTDVAFKANWLKFNQNMDLANELLRTGDRPIVARANDEWSETNSKMLTVIREDLRRRR